MKEEPDARKRAERMLKEGVKRIGKDALVFDPILTCEALGEAELVGANDLQAEAYKRIGMLWGKNYPALSLSIWRKAEKYYKESGQSQELDFLKLNLSLSCFLVGEKYDALDAIVAEKFRVEAGRIIQTVAEPQTGDYSVASFRYTKGTILRNAELLKQARFYYEQNGLWEAAIPCLDEEIRLLLDSGNKLQALPLMERVKEYALKGGETAFAQMVDENMAHIEELQSDSRFMPLDADNLNIFDILDLLAYYEERVIFSDRYQAEKIAMGYESQERREFAAFDIRREISWHLNIPLNFHLPTGAERRLDPIDLLMDFLVKNDIQKEEQLAKYRWIGVKENPDGSIRYETRLEEDGKKSDMSHFFSSTVDNLLGWDDLAKYFDPKMHKRCRVCFDGKEQVIEYFDSWRRRYGVTDGLPYKKLKRPVDSYEKNPQICTYINEAFIVEDGV